MRTQFSMKRGGRARGRQEEVIRFLDYFSGLFYNIVCMRGSIRMRLQQKKEENDYDKKHDRFRQM